jgi:hypothetical protein
MQGMARVQPGQAARQVGDISGTPEPPDEAIEDEDNEQSA